MRREEELIQYERNSFTPSEPWTYERNIHSWYGNQADFALDGIGEGNGECLVIGSPLFEAADFADKGWKVTYLDVRVPRLIPRDFNFVQGDARKLEFKNESFDAVSSTCVLCHAGMGRYAEEVDAEGDIKILNEISRVLKKGCKAAITFGPVNERKYPARVGNVHRVYTMPFAEKMIKDARLKVMNFGILDIMEMKWINGPLNQFYPDRYYLSTLLEKP